ncbi:uncharacterized protein LOC115444195 [Manduca sexta]|uniref:MADF domain-containing protein n=1 Tax=Manduca sexta TaxID=7130 RepID=A0A921Z4F0_MANSE|nr:uncharacterized protein LOC115444195 [Manduca sexta]KAG6451139.1 hypothetical protein O3G_MSEX006966 [Manduca sexta]
MAEPTQNAILRISDEKTLLLIELYHREECLWNTSLEDYKNREKRSEAVARIAKELKIKNFGPRHVVIKFKNLRNSYCQELKKMSNSLNAANGEDYECYKPRVFWFNKMDSFLRPHLQSTKSFVHNLPHLDTERGDEVEEWVQMTNPEDVLLPDTNYLEPSCSETDEYEIRSRKRNVSSDTRSSKRIRTEDYEPGNPSQTLRDISSQLTEMLAHNDCFDNFSRYVASLLRTLPMQKALMLQSKIVEMITAAGIEDCENETAQYTDKRPFQR